MKLQINLVIETEHLKDLAEILDAFEYEQYVTYIGSVIEPPELGTIPKSFHSIPNSFTLPTGQRKVETVARKITKPQFKCDRERVIEIKRLRLRYPHILKKLFHEKVEQELGYVMGVSTCGMILRGKYDFHLRDGDEAWLSIDGKGNRLIN